LDSPIIIFIDTTQRRPSTSFPFPFLPGINGEALAAHVKGVWDAVPDLHLEIINAGEIEPNLVAHHRLLTDTVSVPGPEGNQTTARAIAFKGASIIQVKGDKIASDHVYLDRKMIDSQLAAS
jgi:hypothetical protein